MHHGPKKGGGKGFAANFAKTRDAWFCKPCNWKNQPSAKFCSCCGKAKQWVHDKDKDRQPRDKQAVALKKATDDIRKEFDEFRKELKGGGKGGQRKGPGTGNGGGGKGAAKETKGKGGGKGGAKGKGGGKANGGGPTEPVGERPDGPKGSKVVPGREVFVCYEGKNVPLDDLHEMLRACEPRMGEDHEICRGIRAAIDKAHEKRYELTDPEVTVQHLQSQITRKETAIGKQTGALVELRATRDDIDRQIAEASAKLHNDTQQIESMRKQLQQVQTAAAAKGEWFHPSQLDESAGQGLLRQWFLRAAPQLHDHYEQQAWKCTISEDYANKFMAWKNNTTVIRKFRQHASARTKDEVQSAEAEGFTRAVSAIGDMERAFFLPEFDPLFQTYTVHGASKQLVDVMLECWCTKGAGPVRATRPSALRISGPYFKHENQRTYIQCDPIGEDKVDEAKEVLFSHDPSVKEFVQKVEGSVDHTIAEKLDIRQYMSAILQHKDRIGDMVGVEEYMEQRKKARKEVEEDRGINSPRIPGI